MRWNLKHVLLALAAVALPLVVVFWPRDASADTSDGDVPTMSTEHHVNAQGFVPVEPDDLARAAGVDLNTYALASMMASEAGGENESSQIAVGWACRNHALARGESVSRLLLRMGSGKGTSWVAGVGDGYFGSSAHRYATTARAPAASQLDNAGEILAGSLPDPTGGAERFDTPNASLEDVDAVASKRRAAGLELVTLDDVPNFRFWRST